MSVVWIVTICVNENQNRNQSSMFGIFFFLIVVWFIVVRVALKSSSVKICEVLIPFLEL